MKVLAIDPGYDRLGIAVVEKQKGVEVALFSACVTTNKKQTAGERLAYIGGEIKEVITKWKPDTLATETLFLFSNQKTAFRVAEARGVILYEAARAELSVFEYTPLQIKIAVTGYGRSDKHQITEMVKKLVVLSPKKRLDDEYDALAIGLTCLAMEKFSTTSVLAKKI
ncbi:MAG: crossover junction endodeoxyribonuclease RuvC [Parcubacteria group bacterium Gr01-1014_17]|nr:MAG: crossover junction endodeoxyribonuclease RuvC [Parcubacteria group bacterium Gr01-1014_17]